MCTELIPGGVQGLRRTIGTMCISNLSDLAPLSDYAANVRESYNPLTGTRHRSYTVTVHDRDRHQSVWKLVAAVIIAMENAEHNDVYGNELFDHNVVRRAKSGRLNVRRADKTTPKTLPPLSECFA